jgi:hypothetical protein
MGVHKVSAFHPFIFQKSGKSTMIRNLAVRRHFVSYLVFFSSIGVDPRPTNRGLTSLLALKIRTTVVNTGKLRSIGQMPVVKVCYFWFAIIFPVKDAIFWFALIFPVKVSYSSFRGFFVCLPLFLCKLTLRNTSLSK